MNLIHEGKAEINVKQGKISKKLEVFYNPVMKDNRDISVQLLQTLGKNLQVCDLLAGSGIRSIRFLKELKKGTIKNILINDKSADFFKIMKQNLKLNKINENSIKYYKKESDYKYKIEKNKQNINRKLITNKLINITNEEANTLLYKTSGFDYIEIDPFGSPNPFLDSAAKMISRNGVLAVTATDTAALTGTYLNPTKRKYWAQSLRNELMHEIGLRILIRKIQLIGAQYEKALIPVLSYTKDHYYRTYLKCKKSKTEVDSIQKQHQYFLHCKNCFANEYSHYNNKQCCGKQMLWAGPMWSGKLQDRKTVIKMRLDQENLFLKQLLDEDSINSAGFYNIHIMAKKKKTNLPKFEEIMKRIKKQNYKVSRTHFSNLSLKTDMPPAMLTKLLK